MHTTILTVIILTILGWSINDDAKSYAELDDANLTEKDLPADWKILEQPLKHGTYYPEFDYSYPGDAYYLQNVDKKLGALLFVRVYDRSSSDEYNSMYRLFSFKPRLTNITIGTTNCYFFDQKTMYLANSSGPNWIDFEGATKFRNTTETILTCAKNNVMIEITLNTYGENDTSSIGSGIELTDAILRRLGQD